MSDDKPKKRMGLGRGLDALLGEAIRGDSAPAASADSASNAAAAASPRGGVATVPVGDVHPNPHQPRKYFAEERLAELALSIGKHGILQPIVVRPHAGGYQIVAGERRWRAAQRAQLHQIPAIIRDFDDAETLEIAIIENIQRADLNPIEEAQGYKMLCDQFGHSASELAELVHKSRSHVANMIRLLDLPSAIRDLVVEDKLSMGHARALLGAEDAVQLAMVVIKQGLSVRATEALVKKEKGGGNPSRKGLTGSASRDTDDADIRAVEAHLGDLLGLKVKITQKDATGAGAVTFDYNSLDQLDMLCQRLTGESF